MKAMNLTEKLIELDKEKHIVSVPYLTDMVQCVVPISGGKDSQLTLQRAVETFDKRNILAMFNDTKYEHPLTYDHIKYIERYYGVNVIRLNDGHVYDRIKKYKRFPNNATRFCTNELKIRVGKIFYNNLVDAQETGFQVWYGMRREESSARNKRYQDINSNDLYPPHVVLSSQYPKYLFKKGVVFRLPILDLYEEDVYEEIGIEHLNPLYSKGFDRVGCFPCLAASDTHKEMAFAFDEIGKQRRIEILEIGKEIEKNIFTSKSGRLRNLDSCEIYEYDYGPVNTDESPCFMCNI